MRKYEPIIAAHKALAYAREWLESAKQREPGSASHARALAAVRCMIREARIHFYTEQEAN